MNGPRNLTIAALVVAAVLTVAACGSDSKKAASTTTRKSTTTSATTSPTTTSAATTSTRAASTTGPATSTTRDPNQCATSSLAIVLRPGSPGAGQVYANLVFTNNGATSCTMSGYPGVSLLDASANQIGQPATRKGGTVAPVRLTPGGSASAVLHTVNAGIAPGPCLAPSVKVKVFPPNELDPITAPGTFTVCGNQFDVA
ncbi:MAG: hypothetical protein JWL73_308, partial [Actinomycetia bacterium]|nr:hypothetical protein [Actinomycetes bacterium]